MDCNLIIVFKTAKNILGKILEEGKQKNPNLFRDWGLNEIGNDVLSRIVVQYHPRCAA